MAPSLLLMLLPMGENEVMSWFRLGIEFGSGFEPGTECIVVDVAVGIIDDSLTPFFFPFAAVLCLSPSWRLSLPVPVGGPSNASAAASDAAR